MMLSEGKTAVAVLRGRELVDDVSQSDFDMEAGTNMLSLWSRLGTHGIDDPEYAMVVQRVAHRFSVNKAATEVRVAAVLRTPQAAAWVREAHGEIMQLAETAMNHAVRSQPEAAVETLLLPVQNTDNAKLTEMAGALARRHQERIESAPRPTTYVVRPPRGFRKVAEPHFLESVEPLLESADQLSHRYCAPTTHSAGVRRSKRSAGGLVLRR